MRARQRIERLSGRHALVDGIPFSLPVDSRDTPALMAAFPISAARAAELIPGEEIHPLRLGGDVGLLLITVVDYKTTDIGSYIEFSIAIACTHGLAPAPALLPALLQRRHGTGQFVVDLPVSTEISVKGGKGIWGMPKHQANLDFVIHEDRVWSQYDLDGQLCCRIELDRPRWTGLPLSTGAINYCAFRGMLNKSTIFFRGNAGFKLPLTRSARLTFGDHPRMAPLKTLQVRERPLFVGFFPQTRGILDDHMESWFLTFTEPPTKAPEGLESVVDLGLGREWLTPPNDPQASVATARR
jgi:Acetoacetate decarboxylase (ADC)